MAIRDFFKKFKAEETVEERVDPVVELRRKEKFSSPLIYNDEEIKQQTVLKEEKKTEKPKVVKKPVIESMVTSQYSMSEIISPMTGKKKEDKPVRPVIKKAKKKSTTTKEQLIPVISPFYGAQEEEIEEEVVEEIVTDKKPDSVTENLRNLAKIIKEEENQLKIIEARTGEFQLDFSNFEGEEKTLIEEINDEMTLDELMSLYEKKKLAE